MGMPTETAARERAAALCRKWSTLGRGEQLYLDDAEGGGFRVTGTKRRISSVLTALRDGGEPLRPAEVEDLEALVQAYYEGVVREGGRSNL